MKRPIRVAFFVWLAGCAVSLPEPGVPSALPAGESSPQLALADSPPSPTGVGSVDDAAAARFSALKRCDQVLIAIPSQQLLVKKSAYNHKQYGLLVTTVVGVAGSIITAIVAGGQQADTSGKVDTKPTTVVGASTAGATAVAGIVSLLVVGSGADDRVQLMSDYTQQVLSSVAAFKQQCPVEIKEASAAVCKSEARLLQAKCDAVAKQLPYRVPGQ